MQNRSSRARGLIAIFALPIAGCMAHKNTTSDFDRTPIVNTGARAAIIYPGQSAPPMPGSIPQAQYGAPGAGSQNAHSSGAPPSAPEPAGAAAPPSGGSAPQPQGAPQTGPAPDDQISFLGGSRMDETRHVDVRKEPLVVKYLTAPFKVAAAPFVLAKEAIEGEAEPGPAIPERPDPQLPSPPARSRASSPPAPQDPPSYETAMLTDLERQLDQRNATAERAAPRHPGASAGSAPTSIADELRALQRSSDPTSTQPNTASATAEEAFPQASADPRSLFPSASGIVDRNNDGRIDQWIFRENGEIAREVLDEDYNGRPDRTIVYDLAIHQPSRVEEDSQGDGAVDSWTEFENGAIARRRSDSDHDGSVDTWSFFRGGQLVRHEQDTNGDGYRDAISFFEQGRRVREERDANGDGAPDTLLHYDGDEQLLREEADRDGDGHMEVVSHYRDGKLARREILGAPELAGAAPEAQPSELKR